MSTEEDSSRQTSNVKKYCNTIVSVPNFIRKRQHASISAGFQLTKDQCLQINDVFLPNTMRVVDKSHSKYCCGLYSEDGDKFLSIMQRSVIGVYNTTTPQFKRIRYFRSKTVGWMIDGIFSPCGKYILYYTWPGRTIFMHDIEKDSGEKTIPLTVRTKNSCGAMIFSMKCSADSKEFLAGASDCSIRVHDMDTDATTLYFHGHRGPVNSVAFADNTSQTVITGGEDGICKVWDRRCLRENRPSPVGVLIGHKLGVLFIDSKKDGRQFLSNSKDQTAKLWDIRYCKENEEGRRISRSYRMWDYRREAVPASLSEDTDHLSNDVSIMTYRGHMLRRTLMRCRFSPIQSTGQRYVYAGSADGRIVIYNTLTGKIVKELTGGHRDCVRDIHWHPHRSEIASSSLDGTLGLWTYLSPDAADDYETLPKRKRMDEHFENTEC